MSIEIQKHIDNLFQKVKTPELSSTDKSRATSDKVSFIVDKMSRKKFRRKLTDGARKKLKKKIGLAIENSSPIHFTIPFGGYKHFSSLAYPSPDWAELFNLRFLTEYALPILAVHKPGVVIEYISEDLILTRMNNYPSEALEEYSKNFKKLLDVYNRLLPENMEVRFFRVGDRYDKDKIISKVEKLVPDRIKEFEKLSEKEKEQEIKRSKRSVMWKGEEDLTGLTSEEKYRKIVESRIVELAYYDVEADPEFMGNYLWEDENITLCFSFGISPDNVFEDLALATCKGCVVDFWIGTGVLEQREGRFLEKILSKKQYANVASDIREVKVDSPLSDMKNFQTIGVYKY